MSDRVLEFATKEEETKFKQFIEEHLPSILTEADYDELYGYQLTPEGDYFDKDIRDSLAFKFLKARSFDLEEARKQLLETLKWRKTFQPLKAAFTEVHDSKLLEIGILTQYGDEIYNWNIYGGSKDYFDDLDKFLRYRVGLMERGLQLLDFKSPTKNQLAQIHDYEGVSFFRFDSKTSKASKTVVQLFQAHYPELLSKKFFVNVPSLMAWIYDLARNWLPAETSKKFRMLGDGKKLVEFVNKEIPEKYGGKGSDLNTQDIKNVDPTPYTKYLLEHQFTEEVD